jgi:predicted amidophosphoribosyltransferase
MKEKKNMPEMPQEECASCQKPFTNDERSRLPVCGLSVACDACARDFWANELANEMMREALAQPGFRNAIATLCAAAAIHGSVEFRWKNGKFYRLEKPLE